LSFIFVPTRPKFVQ